MYGYIYLTTNLVNGMKYVGKHKSSKFVSNKYIGSGLLLHRDIKKNNFDKLKDFKVELIEECYSLEQLNEREIYWIKEFDAINNPNFYNIHFGGDGGDISLFMSDEDMKRIRNDHSNYIKDRIKNDKSFHDLFVGAKDGHTITDSTKNKISNKQLNYWSNVDESVKHERLSKSATTRCTGRIWITNDIEDKFIKPEDINKYPRFRVGRKFKSRNRKCATTNEI